MTKKEITNEDLAKKIDAQGKKSDGHDQKFEVLAKKLDGHDKNFKKLTNEIESLARSVALGFEKTNEKIDNVDAKLSARIDEVEHEMKQGFASVDRRFDHLESKIAKIEVEIKDIKTSLARLAKRTIEDDDIFVDDIVLMQKRITVLEKQVAALKASKLQPNS